MKKILCILCIISTSFSCDNDDGITLTEQNFLIFGHFYGECIGEGCVETFMLTGEQLFEDTIDDYSGQDLNFIELDNAKFEQAKDLKEFFPNQLLITDIRTYGCPDCADGGGLFIQFSENGEKRTWRIDQDKDQVPDFLHEFIDQVNEKIALISD